MTHGTQKENLRKEEGEKIQTVNTVHCDSSNLAVCDPGSVHVRGRCKASECVEALKTDCNQSVPLKPLSIS